MKPGLILNCHDRNKNPLFEAHDPSMMKDPISREYYSYATDTAITSAYVQGIPLRKSKDLINFEYVGTVLSDKAIEEARNNGEFPPTGGFWAPFVECVCGEYRMYYSATKAFGSSESKIWLAVSDKPEGPFENRGVVVDTWFTDDTFPNGIDAHVVDDTEGNKYLIYGSFFGGIYCKKISPETGLSLDGDPRELGIPLAVKPKNAKIDGPEGASVIYNPKNKFYYLFLSYGWLGENYDIRVGRSKQVEGPYLDHQGSDLNGQGYGLKLANSYCFYGEKPYVDESSIDPWTYDGFRGPGHGVPFYDEDKKEYFFVHHMRDGAKELKYTSNQGINPTTYTIHYMFIRKMEFLSDWPVFSPEPYCGEEKGEIAKEKLIGQWEMLLIDDQNNEVKRSSLITLSEEDIAGYSEMNGILEFAENKSKEFSYGIAQVFPCFSIENSCETICLTGFTKDKTAFWAKKTGVHSTETTQ